MKDAVNQLERSAEFFERFAQQIEAEEQNRASIRKSLIGDHYDPDMSLPHTLYNEAEKCRQAAQQLKETT